MSVKEVNALDVLKDYVDGFATKGDAASALACSKQYLNDMLNRHRDISPRMLAKLGLKRTVIKDRG